MARSTLQNGRSSVPSPSWSESNGTGLLGKRISELEATNPAKVRFDAPEVTTLEDAVRATVRDVFGSTSEEARQHGSFKFARQGWAIGGPADRREIEAYMQRQFTQSHPQAVATLRGLIQRVEERTVGDPTPAARRATIGGTGRRVFLVHGQNEKIKQSVARVLEQLDLQPIILHEQADMGRTVIEKFEDHGSEVGFAVILMTGDDRGGAAEVDHEKYRRRARQNVLLEMGFFLGSLGRRRVCVLYEPEVEIPSDYTGVLYKKLDEAGAWRFELARELRAAGIEVDVNQLLA
jgi:predicted nucleotide-binding protein